MEKEIDWIFIHNPKTGGETIRTLLNIPGENKHARASQIKNIKEKYSFAFVRHPVSRMISWYNHLLKHKYFSEIKTNSLNNKSECYRKLKLKQKMTPIKERELAERYNINGWIKILLKKSELFNKKAGPLSLQYTYIYSKTGEKLVSDVYKFENYTENLKTILGKIGKEELISNIEKTNHSIKKNCELTEESKKLIYEYFKKDFELFNYNL
tara:strand:- start:686 stop:1318 length:633 start_codon:yes stop_codon:yes gene_type:complete